ncbi:MAG: serine/threonine protein kinase [Lautropia sp. SCN 70-15]|jgi:serine/threonine protein kinase|nr:MAG: serine/threonine protein kinase [Lautropia sp. SCN 70-15]
MGNQNNAPLPDGIEVGGYRIVRKIASGGFSIVYLAEDDTGEKFAIKEYLPSTLVKRAAGQLAPSIPEQNLNTFRNGLRCFFEEGRALARIFHPNVVRVVNFFRAFDTVYMVMAWERGRSLQEVVLRNRRRHGREVMAERHIVRVFNLAMNGLREVHANRLLHLDLKPANIYLRFDGTPLLLDFGAARRALDAEPQRLFPMYTPGFAAPELYRRTQQLGPWTDVYGLGASMLGCMLGQPPQQADQRELDDRLPATLDSLAEVYSRPLLDLVGWCLKLNPLERPQSVFALQRALRGIAAAAGEPNPLRPTTIGRWLDSRADEAQVG